MIRKIKKRLLFGLALLLILIAFVSSVFRALTPLARTYKPQLEVYLSQKLGEAVHIKNMNTGWYWFRPVVELQQIAIASHQKELLSVNKLFVGINLFQSLWHWRLQPGLIYFDELQLTLREAPDEWRIDGLDGDKKLSQTVDKDTLQAVMAFILSEEKILVKELKVTIYFQDGRTINIHDSDFMIERHGNLYQIKSRLQINQQHSTVVKFFTKVRAKDTTWAQTVGEAFIAVDNFDLSQWLAFLPPDMMEHFIASKGNGNVRMWLKWDNNGVQYFQSALHMPTLTIEDRETKKSYCLEAVQADIQGQLSNHQWKFTLSPLSFIVDKKPWPMANYVFEYSPIEKRWLFYTNKLNLANLSSILKNYNVLPDLVKKNPSGLLTDVQIQGTEQQVEYILTGFSNVSLSPQGKVPGIQGLNGALHVEKQEGHIELGGDNVSLVMSDKPPILLKKMDIALTWKELNAGFLISIERAIVQNAQLLLSLEGHIDHWQVDTGGDVDLKTKFTVMDVEKWLQYLPQNYIKAKLDHWLKKDIRHIDMLSGELSLKGSLADFPFDNGNGLFQGHAYVSNASLVFAPHFPLTTDINADLTVKGRDLNIQLEQANLLDNKINNAEVIIKNMGQQERLWLHTRVDLDAHNALTYVRASPLHKKLSALSDTIITGPLSLDLRLDVPLYPEDDTVLTAGTVIFKDNEVTVNDTLTAFPLKNVQGTLLFDEKGIIESRFNALVDKYPVNFSIQSIHTKNPYVQILLNAKTSIDVLEHKFKLPIFSFIQGVLTLEGALAITDDIHDLDHLLLKTNLQGVAVHLPAPLGKAEDTITPLTLSIDFNPDKAMRVGLDYKDLTGDLTFLAHKQVFIFDKGALHIGQVPNKPADERGLSVDVKLPFIDLHEWRDLQKTLQGKGQTQNSLKYLRSLHIQSESVAIGNRRYPSVDFTLLQKKPNDFNITVAQALVNGSIDYHIGQDSSLKGHLKYLHIDDAFLAEINKTSENLATRHYPLIDLLIDDFSFNHQSIGTVSLQGKPEGNEFLLQSLVLSRPDYTFFAKGSSTLLAKNPYTHVEAQLQIKNLATFLTQAHITPIVESKKGVVQFKGGWPGGFNAFQLGKIEGYLNIVFKNGRITHLSPETEAKLGLGKLLSILSLQTIPRRLQLDFSDLAKDGYSFDEFRGDFSLSKGILNTSNAYINGPIAYASMKGNLDIVKQLYNLQLVLSPHVAASLPVVATLAGGPVAGFATWVATKLINQGVQKISGYTYHISGPWREPVVQHVNFIKSQTPSS